MIFCTCISRANVNNTTVFSLIDSKGTVCNMDRHELLRQINNKSIFVSNLTVDSLGRVRLKSNTKLNTVNNSVINKNSIILYHGSYNKDINVTYGLGEDKHDYGKGFYLTPNAELAKEWAVCRGDSIGYLHVYELDISGLKILDFDNEDILSWIAELMKHRDADKSQNYKVRSKQFIAKFGIDTSGYDIIKGWRADSSYFYIAKEFVRNNVDVSILKQLLQLGDLGIQYCLKSKRAMEDRLHEIKSAMQQVNGQTYYQLYNQRDFKARQDMRNLIANTRLNRLETTFNDLVR